MKEQQVVGTETTWNLRLFGTLEVRRPDGSEVEIRSVKARALLAYLALHRDTRFSREHLAALLWPDSDPSNRRTRLRQELSKLRAIFGDTLEMPRSEVVLHSSVVCTDVARFREALKKAEDALPENKERLLSEATDLYRAELLIESDGWGDATRLELMYQFEQALRDLATVRQTLGDSRGAEASLQRLVAHDPLRVETHVDLMRLYAEQGQPSRVQRQYQQLQRILREELDIEPTDATRHIAEELRQKAEQSSLEVVSDAMISAVVRESDSPPADPEREEATPAIVPLTAPSPQRVAPPAVSSLRFMQVAIPALYGLVLLAFLSFRRPVQHRMSVPPPPAALLQRHQEKWTFFYQPRPGEKPSSEARAMFVGGPHGNIYVTGLIQTEKEDADILTLCLSPEGKPLKAVRYTSPTHDCDRAFSISTWNGGIYVAGETFIPARPGVEEGWRLTLIKYDWNLKQLWAVHPPFLMKNEGHRITVAYDGIGGAYLCGTTLDRGTQKMLLLRYDGSGRKRWSRSVLGKGAKSTHFQGMDLTVNGTCVRAVGTAFYGSDQNGAVQDSIIVCCDREGRNLWTRHTGNLKHGGPVAGAIARNTFNDFSLMGNIYTGDPAYGGRGVNLAVSHYSEGGDLLWTRRDPDSGPDMLYATSTINKGIVTLAGWTAWEQRDSRFHLVQYDSLGNRRWIHRYSPPPGFRSVCAVASIKCNMLDLRTEFLQNVHEKETYDDTCV